MTEAEWNASPSPAPLLDFLQPQEGISDRKLRLFVCACCRRIAVLPDQETWTALQLAERFADGRVPEAMLATARKVIQRLFVIAGPAPAYLAVHVACDRLFPRDAARAADAVIRDLAECLPHRPLGSREQTLASLRLAEQAVQADLLRCIFGPLAFRPVTIAASWRTPAFVSLAQQVYNSRDFARLPELAEAMVAEGCEEAELLGHLCSGGPHGRGCFVLDLLLGRK